MSLPENMTPEMWDLYNNAVAYVTRVKDVSFSGLKLGVQDMGSGFDPKNDDHQAILSVAMQHKPARVKRPASLMLV